MISAILCTHNPRPDYLLRTLEALKRQTLSSENWELVVVDNLSTPPIAQFTDLRWHPHGRIVREETLGTAHARLRGIRESAGDLIVVVDDDNVLADDYLETGLRVAGDWPQLGAWGGSCEPEFERAPPAWAEPYVHMLGLRRVTRPLWGNVFYQEACTPFGAGMCVRRQVAEAHYRTLELNPHRRGLGRRGASLDAFEDVDLACTALDLGLGTGVFPELSLTHLIRGNRLEEDYLVRLREAFASSWVWFSYFRGQIPPVPPARSLPGRIMDFIRLHRMDRRSRLFHEAQRRGQLRASTEVLQHRRRPGLAVPPPKEPQ